LIKNGTWKLVDPSWEPNQLAVSGSSRKNIKQMASIDKHKARLVEKGFAHKEGVDYEDNFPQSKMGYHPDTFCLGSLERLEISSNGCKDFFLEWRFQR